MAQNVSSYKSAGDFAYAIGEVVNTGLAEADRLQIAASLLDENNQTVGAGAVSSIFFPVNVLKPGEKTAFKAFIEKAPVAWKETRIQVQAQAATASSKAAYYLDLRVEGATLNAASGQFKATAVAGQITNTGTGIAASVALTVGFYDTAGKLVGVGDTYAKLEQIGPGLSAPFSVEVYDLTQTPATFEVFFRARKVA